MGIPPLHRQHSLLFLLWQHGDILNWSNILNRSKCYPALHSSHTTTHSRPYFFTSIIMCFYKKMINSPLQVNQQEIYLYHLNCILGSEQKIDLSPSWSLLTSFTQLIFASFSTKNHVHCTTNGRNRPHLPTGWPTKSSTQSLWNAPCLWSHMYPSYFCCF